MVPGTKAKRCTFERTVQIKKNTAVASAMTAVASHPTTSMGRGRVNLPMMR